jgi:hypothetical protein
MATNNSINLGTAGITGYNGTGTFTGTPVTAFNVILGGATNDTLVNVAPSVTSGIPLVSSGSLANPVFGTAVVPGGGSGLTSTTAFAVLAGGTTSTGNLQQVSGLGSAGQVLTSAGAGALPVWAASGTPSAQAPYLNVTGTTQTMVVNEGYVSNNAGLVTFTPPATCAVGTIFAVAGAGAGGWTINCATNSQTINYGSSPATTALASTNQFDSVKFVCITANTVFTCLDSIGNLTIS